MNDEARRELLEVQAFFRLPSVSLVEKDFYVARAIGAIAALDASPFTLIFCGGTALARAHRLVQRMSEDVDFKVVSASDAPLSNNKLRQQRGTLHDLVTATLRDAGFALEPGSRENPRSRDSNQYIVWQLPYDSDGAGEGLRPTIQVELTYAPFGLPPFLCPSAPSSPRPSTGHPKCLPCLASALSKRRPRSWCR